jgi:hypothetical protein
MSTVENNVPTTYLLATTGNLPSIREHWNHLMDSFQQKKQKVFQTPFS